MSTVSRDDVFFHACIGPISDHTQECSATCVAEVFMEIVSSQMGAKQQLHSDGLHSALQALCTMCLYHILWLQAYSLLIQPQPKHGLARPKRPALPPRLHHQAGWLSGHYTGTPACGPLCANMTSAIKPVWPEVQGWCRINWTICFYSPSSVFLQQNTFKICPWLPSSCKQNLLLFIQPRWQLRRTYLFNHYNVLFQWICVHRPSQTQNK